MSFIHQGSAFLSLTISTDERICTIHNYFPLIIASQDYYTHFVVTPVWVNIKTSIRGNGYQEYMTWNFIDIKWHATTAFEYLIWFDLIFFFDPNVLCQKVSYTIPVVRRYVLPSYTVIQVGIKVVECFFFFRYNAWGNLIQHVRKLKINKKRKKKAWLSLETNRKNFSMVTNALNVTMRIPRKVTCCTILPEISFSKFLCIHI